MYVRLWHEGLIPVLPRQQLLGQHRECAALRGRGWGKAHATVHYVFSYSPFKLYQYHVLVMEEMRRRGYHPDEKWYDSLYRGKYISAYTALRPIEKTSPIYPEHNAQYYNECIKNLADKNILIT